MLGDCTYSSAFEVAPPFAFGVGAIEPTLEAPAIGDIISSAPLSNYKIYQARSYSFRRQHGVSIRSWRGLLLLLLI